MDEGTALKVWILSLTSFNLFSAGLVVLLVFLDSRKSGWRGFTVPSERRTPVYLAVSILAANVIFCIREVGEINALASDGATDALAFDCTVYNELSWLGIWCPILALAARLCLVAVGDIFEFNPWSKLSESAYVVVVAFTLVVAWVPSRILGSSPCSPFVMLFSPDTNSSLGLAGLIILLIIYVSIGISATIILRQSYYKRRKSAQVVYNIHYDPWVSEDQQNWPSSVDERLAENTSAYYSLSLSCQYARTRLLPCLRQACFLANFGLVTVSRGSNAVAYLSSVLILTTGIVLLLQYLYLRNRDYSQTCPTPSLVSNSVGSVEVVRRKLRRPPPTNPKTTQFTTRPYTTYGGGREFEDLYPPANQQTPPDEKVQSNRTISDSVSTSEMREYSDARPNIPQDLSNSKPSPLGRLPTKTVVPPSSSSSRKHSAAMTERECHNLSGQPYYENENEDQKSSNTIGQRVGSKIWRKRSSVLEQGPPSSMLPPSLTARPSTSPSRSYGSSLRRSLHLRTRPYTAARSPLSTTVDSSVIGNGGKPLTSSDQASSPNWIPAGMGESMSGRGSEESFSQRHPLINHHGSVDEAKRNSVMSENQHANGSNNMSEGSVTPSSSG